MDTSSDLLFRRFRLDVIMWNFSNLQTKRLYQPKNTQVLRNEQGVALNCFYSKRDTKVYRKADKSIYQNLNKKAKSIADNLDIVEKIEYLSSDE